VKLYIETTVPNFLFADDAPEKQSATVAFFEWLTTSPDELFPSELVFAELEQTPERSLREKLMTALANLDCVVFPLTPEAVGFPTRLIAEGVIPTRYQNDAVHAAFCVLHEMDVLVTWNMKHLVNPRKIEAINLSAMRAGYRPIRIHTPEEVMMI
jgi:predicted nucleic acid-binding protein